MLQAICNEYIFIFYLPEKLIHFKKYIKYDVIGRDWSNFQFFYNFRVYLKKDLGKYEMY